MDFRGSDVSEDARSLFNLKADDVRKLDSNTYQRLPIALRCVENPLEEDYELWSTPIPGDQPSACIL